MQTHLAVQLAQTAVVDADNKRTISELWEEVLEMVQLLSLPHEGIRVVGVVEAPDKGSLEEGRVRFVARLEDCERVFAVLLKYRGAEGFVTSATATFRMVEIVE